MTGALLALCAALSQPARASSTCESLEHHGRVHRAARAAARPWADVKAAFLEVLSAQPKNASGLRAAEFLRSSHIGLAEAPVADAVGAPAGAEYDPQSKLIVLDAADLAPLWKAWPNPKSRARVLKETASRLAPVVVHELAHARLREELGPVPPFAEEELLADAEETLYLWGRLDADPDALGLRKFDALVEPGQRESANWWKRPVSLDDLALDRAVEGAEAKFTDQWVSERWRLVRGMGGGYDAFSRTLSDGGVLEGLSIFSMSDKERRRALADTRRLRAAHERCLASADAADRKDLEGWVARLSGEELAYEDAGQLKKVAGRYRAVMDTQRRDLETLRGSAAR